MLFVWSAVLIADVVVCTAVHGLTVAPHFKAC